MWTDTEQTNILQVVSLLLELLNTDTTQAPTLLVAKDELLTAYHALRVWQGVTRREALDGSTTAQ